MNINTQIDFKVGLLAAQRISYYLNEAIIIVN